MNLFIGIFDVHRTSHAKLLEVHHQGAFVHLVGSSSSEDNVERAATEHFEYLGLAVVETLSIDSLRSIEERGEVPSDEFRYLSTFVSETEPLVIGDIFSYTENDE